MTGFNISDIAVIGIIFLFFFFGIRKGFIKSILGLVSIIISIVLALLLYQPVASFLKNSVIGEYVTVNIVKTIENSPKEETENKETNILNLPEELLGNLTKNIDEVKETTVATVSESVANIALNVISMLVVFLLVKIILWILTMILETFTKLPIIKTLDKLMGGVWEAASGVIVVYLLLALLTFVTAVNSENAVVKNVLESEVASKMYNDNFIVNIITPDNSELND